MPSRSDPTRPGRMLGSRALNRALLERQMLLRREPIDAVDAAGRLVALQAQVPRDPYVALWSRVDGFRPSDLATALEERRAVRMTLLRGTLHLVTAGDALAMRPLVQPAIERVLLGSSPLRRAAASVDLDELLAFLRDVLEERSRTRADLVRAVRERWPDRDADALGYAMYLLPTVQVTPRGVWGRTGKSAFTTVERWLDRALDPDPGPDGLVLRYLSVFGPAGAADFTSWSGLRGARAVFERLRPRLRTFRDDQGRELFDVPDGSLPDPDTPAPVRFLPEYDNVGLGHTDRRRIVPQGTGQWTEVGWGGVLVDGFLAGRWRLDAPKGETVLRVEPFRAFSAAERRSIGEEGERLLAFLAPDPVSQRVELDD